MTRASKPPLRLRGRRAGVIRLLVLPPAAIATLALALEAAVRGSVTPHTLFFSGMMLSIAGLGLLHDALRQSLVADDDGIRWSRGLSRRLYRWADIEEIGRSRPLGFHLRDPVAGLAPGASHEGLGSTHVGLRLVVSRSQPAFRRSGGYDVILMNDFGVSTRAIVDDLRDRLRAAVLMRGPNGAFPAPADDAQVDWRRR